MSNYPRKKSGRTAGAKNIATTEEEKRKIAMARRAETKKLMAETGALRGQRLSAPKKAGYYRRWVNDYNGGLERRLDMGYDHAHLSERELRLTSASENGGKVRRLVGTQNSGQPLYAYLLEIPEELFVEDRKEYLKSIADTEQGLLDGNIKSRTDSDQVWSGEVKFSQR